MAIAKDLIARLTAKVARGYSIETAICVVFSVPSLASMVSNSNMRFVSDLLDQASKGLFDKTWMQIDDTCDHGKRLEILANVYAETA